jgi:hypothetical protein
MIVLHDIKAKSAKKIDGIVSLAMASLGACQHCRRRLRPVEPALRSL